LVVEVEKLDALGWVYLQPNYFNVKENTHGIIENGFSFEIAKKKN